VALGCGGTPCTHDTECPGTQVCANGRCQDQLPDGGWSDGDASQDGDDVQDGGGDRGDAGPGAALLVQASTFETGPAILTSGSYRLVSDGLLGTENSQIIRSESYIMEGCFVW